MFVAKVLCALLLTDEDRMLFTRQSRYIDKCITAA